MRVCACRWSVLVASSFFPSNPSRSGLIRSGLIRPIHCKPRPLLVPRAHGPRHAGCRAARQCPRHRQHDGGPRAKPQTPHHRVGAHATASAQHEQSPHRLVAVPHGWCRQEHGPSHRPRFAQLSGLKHRRWPGNAPTSQLGPTASLRLTRCRRFLSMSTPLPHSC